MDELDRVSADHGSTSIDSITPPVTGLSYRSMPKIKLPKFSGNYTDWDNFKDLFISLVHSNPGVSSVEKLHHLKSSLTGEAAQLLRRIPITQGNYLPCWELLTERFENKRVLINSHLAEIFSIQNMKSESSSSLKEIYNSTVDNVEASSALDEPVSAWSSWLVYITVEKLDRQSRRNWETSLGNSTDSPTFDQLKLFLQTKIRTLEVSDSTLNQPGQSTPQQSSRSKSQHKGYGKFAKSSNSATVNVNAVTEHSVKNLPSNEKPTRKFRLHEKRCFFCREPHYLMSCPKFQDQSVTQKLEFILQRKLCTNCLGSHSFQNCASQNVCQICHEKHHTILHDPHLNSVQSSMIQVSPSTSNAVSVMQITQNESPLVLLTTAMVNVTASTGHTRCVRAFIDQGSDVSIISESLAQSLHLPRQRGSIVLLGVGESKSGTSRGSVIVVVTLRFDSEFKLEFQALVLPKLISKRLEHQINHEDWSHLSGLQLADPNFSGNAPIDIILGADVNCSLIDHGLRKGPPGSPIAQRTALGWILCGPSGKNSSFDSSRVHMFHYSKGSDLFFDLQKFWEDHEIIPSKPFRTAEEEECERHYAATHSRTQDGRYVVHLPTKSGYRPTAVQAR